MQPAIAVCFVAALFAAETMRFHVAPAPDTQMSLFVEKTGLLGGKKHHFVFDRFTGAADLEALSVTLEIDAVSIRCLDTWVSEKDRRKILAVATEDMLAASKYPAIRFRSEQVVAADAARYDVRGVLTIQDVSKPLRIVATRLGTNRFSGEARIRLKDFGLSPPSAAMGLIGTKDEMRFAFRIALTETQL